MLGQRASALSLFIQVDLLVRHLAARFADREVDLALEGRVDIGGGQHADVARRADHRGIGVTMSRSWAAHAVREEALQLGDRRLVVGSDAELGDQRVLRELRIVGRDQHVRIGRALVAGIDDLLVERDRQRDRRLPEGGVALGDDRDQHDRQEDRPMEIASSP